MIKIKMCDLHIFISVFVLDFPKLHNDFELEMFVSLKVEVCLS